MTNAKKVIGILRFGIRIIKAIIFIFSGKHTEDKE